MRADVQSQLLELEARVLYLEAASYIHIEMLDALLPLLRAKGPGYMEDLCVRFTRHARSLPPPMQAAFSNEMARFGLVLESGGCN